MHSNVHCSTVYNSQDREATKMFTDKQKDKENVIYHTQWNITQSWKIIKFAATWMDLEIVVGQTEKDIYYLQVESENWQKWTNLQTQTDSQT